MTRASAPTAGLMLPGTRPGDEGAHRRCYHPAVMHAMIGMLAMVAVALPAPVDDVHPIEVKAEHEAVAWWVELADPATACHAKAWIGRMGEQPLATPFAVDLDEDVAPTAEGETPLYGLAPGTYDVHFESDGCRWVFSLVGR